MSTVTGSKPNLVPEGATGIGGLIFRATLVATTNWYLRDSLPLDGFVQIVERSIHGDVQPHGALFMPDAAPGEHTSFVRVEHARFEFCTRPTATT